MAVGLQCYALWSQRRLNNGLVNSHTIIPGLLSPVRRDKWQMVSSGCEGGIWGVYGNPPPKINFPHVSTEWKSILCLPLLYACQDCLLYLFCKKHTVHFPIVACFCIWPGRQHFVSLFSNMNEVVSGEERESSTGKFPVSLRTPLPGDAACSSFSVSVPGEW